MKIFNNIRNYIGEDSFRIIIYEDKVDIVNYNKIIDINDNKIVLDKIIVEGENLKVKKLLDNELLLFGKIGKIYFEQLFIY